MCLCGRPWSLCGVVGAVDAVTVMCVLDVSVLRECKGARVTAMIVWGTDGGVGMSTRGSCTVSSASDVLGMSVVHDITGADGVCDMCMCLARGSEWIRGFDLGFTNHVGTGRVLVMCLCCGDVGANGWGSWARIWKGGVVLCLCESVFVV